MEQKDEVEDIRSSGFLSSASTTPGALPTPVVTLSPRAISRLQSPAVVRLKRLHLMLPERRANHDRPAQPEEPDVLDDGIHQVCVVQPVMVTRSDRLNYSVLGKFIQFPFRLLVLNVHLSIIRSVTIDRNINVVYFKNK